MSLQVVGDIGMAAALLVAILFGPRRLKRWRDGRPVRKVEVGPDPRDREAEARLLLEEAFPQEPGPGKPEG